ncbi:uncharacterized protein [Hetaerina americana]|uniref:uncharacterized protein n=1 Tax=Hetaerina americana TaxID=62018 RepID=UPI003A7F431E
MGDLSQFISRESLIQSLRSFTGRADVKLFDEFEVRRATKGAQGLTSIVLRVRVPYCLPEDGRKLWKNFIVKAFPQNPFQMNLVKKGGLFDKEGVFFKEVVPLLVKASGGKVDVPLPNCYRAMIDGRCDAIYLEDLAESGYMTPDRTSHTNDLDYEHCSLVMGALGRFHALTVATEQLLLPSKNWLDAFPIFSTDSLFYCHKEGESTPPLLPTAEASYETLLKMSRLMDGVPKKVEASGALRKVLENNWSTLCRLVKCAPQGCNVLSHGDCWLNNLLFRYEDGVPVEVKMIDLQIVRYCHPSIDILYFFSMCTSKEFRERNIDGLIHEYYKSLTKELNVLGYGAPPISLERLNQDMREIYRPFGVIINSFFRPNILLGEDFMPSERELNPTELEKLFNTNNATAIVNKFCRDPEFRTQMETIIREVVDWAFPQEAISDK